jgi:hypothetical protein
VFEPLHVPRLGTESRPERPRASPTRRDGTIGRDELRKRLDFEELQKRLGDDNAGTKALSWLLQAGQHEQLESTSNMNFFNAAAWCIVGEGKTDFWWDLMTIQHVPKLLGDIAVSETQYNRMRWQNVLLNSLFDAQLFWPSGSSAWDAPVASFLKVLRINSAKQSGRQLMSVVGAHGWLAGHLPFDLSTRDRRAINVDHWDAHAAFTKRYHTNVEERLYKSSLLDLTHPTDPNVDSSLEFYRKAETSTEVMQFATRIAGGRFLRVCKHLVYQCHHQGRTADARWAMGFYQTMRSLREERQLPGDDEWSRWDKSDRRAAENELALGVPVDAHGRIAKRFNFDETLEEARERA